MSEQKVPSSFRDPSGSLFWKNGELYRRVYFSYQDHYDRLIASGLYDELVKRRLLIPHDEVSAPHSDEKNTYKLLKPEIVPFISYPFEWSFGQLKDAALRTLEIQKLALNRGLTLKDASAYNIQFLNGRPILIDTLSFERYEEGKPWIAYRQFCQHFLAPLALMSQTDIRLAQLLRVYIDGIPLDLACKLLPLSSRFNPSLLMHIYLHAKSQQQHADRATSVKKAGFGRLAFLGLIDSLEKTINNLKWQLPKTEWSNYYQITNYSNEAKNHKKQLVSSFLEKTNAASVWDLGANTGFFSRLASSRGIRTIAFDCDPAAVETNYQETVRNQENLLLPLVIDLTNPTSGLGWANEERMSLIGRGPVDAVLALALIHHLAISNNVPLEQVAEFFSRLCRYLIVEFVPKNDSQVQKLLATREDIFPDYRKESFEEKFNRYFSIEMSAGIHQSERTLYLLKNRLHRL